MFQPTQLKHFLPICKLGQGTFSTVYKVKRITDNQIYALKKIKMQKLKPKQKQNSLNQIRILASIKSKFIISYKQAFYDQSLNLLCIVMEYANQGDLQGKIKQKQKQKIKFTQQQIWKAASQILIGLFILHQKNILHRDLKSANIFISNNQYKLGDLNVSKCIQNQDQMAKTQTGTPYYASPQVWRDQPYNNKCDIWSYGCLLYQMCTFQPPFQGDDLDQLYHNVQKGKFKPIPSVYSNQLSILIKKCLTVDIKQRPASHELIQQFSKIKWRFMETVEKNQIEISNNLLNTIKLPFDLRDLTKSLPISEYKNNNSSQFIQKNIKNQKYPQSSSARKQKSIINEQKSISISIDKNKQINKNINIKQIPQLPQRIKQYLIQPERKTIKRPQRPVTSIKRNHMILRSLPSNQQRPLTAAPYIKKQQSTRKIKPLVKNHNVNKSYGRKYVNNDKKRQTIEQTAIVQKRKIPYLGRLQNKKVEQSVNIVQKSRCSSPSNSISNKKRCISASSQKNTRNVANRSQQSRQQLSLSTHQQTQKYLNLLQLQKSSYEKCCQVSLKRIDSLQKKVKYIRDHRKQRKYLIQQNKQNNQTILIKKSQLQLKRILQNKNTSIISNNNKIRNPNPKQPTPTVSHNILSQPQQPHIISHILNPIQQINHLSAIRKRLQIRKQNLYTNRRYVVSAESKRNNHNSMIQKNSQIGLGKLEEKDTIRKNKKVGGIMRKVPSAHCQRVINVNMNMNNSINSININNNNSRMNNQKLPSLLKNSQSLLIEQQYNKFNLQQKIYSNCQQNQKQSINNLINDNQTILRLKKRIKNRILCESNQQEKNIIYGKLIK